jgi:hypothetical protein
MGLSASLTRLAMSALPDVAADAISTSKQYRICHRRLPNLLHPRRFTEKVARRALFDQRPILKTFADKYAVRHYVEDILGKDVLPELYYETQSPKDIPFSKLPEQFVVKPTHGSGWVRVVRSKAQSSFPEIVSECKYWLAQDFYKECRERNYIGIPRRIIIEELIDDGSDGLPTDYKMFVFHGKVELIQVIRGRSVKIEVYHLDRAWNPIALNFNYDPFPGTIPPPPHLPELIAAAEALGRDIEFVRADFYDTPAKIYFGELTGTPSAGMDRFVPDSFDEHFGALW